MNPDRVADLRRISDGVVAVLNKHGGVMDPVLLSKAMAGEGWRRHDVCRGVQVAMNRGIVRLNRRLHYESLTMLPAVYAEH
jgi:hypothetical protein